MEQKKSSEAVKGVRKYERRIKELTYQVGPTFTWSTGGFGPFEHVVDFDEVF